MTKEQYKSELGVIASKLRALSNRKEEIREAFLLANAEFKEGDRVVVVYDAEEWMGHKTPEKKVDAFISNVNDKYFHGDVRYEFTKVKKDGTMSQQSAGLSGNYSRIELWNPERSVATGDDKRVEP